MTDKEIALWLHESRWCAGMSVNPRNGDYWSHYYAKLSVEAIHHIINSINWED